MHNTYITSTLTLRTRRGSFPFSYNNNGDYLYASTQTCPYAYYSSSRTSCCCSCCANSVYRMPISPCYTYDLYGCRQSSLIQCRKLSLGGFDRGYYSRVSSSCDKGYGLREKSVKRGGLRRRMVIEERSESCDIGEDMDETEALLSLLTEDVGEECFRVRKESKRVVKKPVVEEKEEVRACRECRSKKKKKKRVNDLGVLESGEYELVIRKRGDTSEKTERVDEEEREGLSRKDNRKVRKMDEEEEDSVRKASRKEVVVQGDESQSLLRKEVSTASAKEEDIRRREEHRHRMRKDGSSCSSYYSFSSNGDYESENDVERREGRFTGEASSMRENIVRSEIDHQEAGEKYQRREDYREEDVGTSLIKKTNAQETHVGSSVVESEFRKKSEKKLLDESVEEVVSRKGTKEMGSELSTVQESGYGKSSKSYARDDGRKVISSGGSKLDFEKQLLSKQTGVQILSQSDAKMKYKQSGDMMRTNSDDVKTSYASQQIKGSENRNSAKAASSSSQAAVGLSNREDEIQRYSRKATVVSDTIDIDIRKTSISLQETETSVKKMEDRASIVSGTNYDAENKHHHDEVRGQVVPTRKSQQLTKGDNESSVQMQSDNQLAEQRENVNLSYGSYLDSEKRKSQSQAYSTHRDDSRYRTDELTETSVRHSGDSSATVVLDSDKTKPGTVVRGQSSQLEPISASAGMSEITTEMISDESLQSGQTTVHGRHLGRSTAVQHEDVIGSAARLQKSSEHYIGEFVDNVRHEIMSSETQLEKKTYKTALVHEEEEGKKSLIENTSVDSESKEYDSRRVSQGSGVKGPSDEMWKVDESMTREQSTVVLQEDENKGENAVVKRTGRSLWNVIGDVLRLRWSPQSDSHSTGGKSGGRSSPIQSAGSETWFSGHEAEEKEEATRKKESAISTQEFVSEIRGEEKTQSHFEEGSSSSTLTGHLKHAGINLPSSSVALQSGSATTSTLLPPTVETSRTDSGGTSNASEFQLRRSPVVRSASTDSGGTSNASGFRLRRSPVVRSASASASASEGGEANVSDSAMSEQLNSGGSGEQSGPAADVAEQKRRGKLLRKDQIVRDRFDEWEEAYMIEAEQRKLDEIFMREALMEAQKAGDNWEVPVGAVLVHNGKIIARGYNLVEELRDSTAHAEMICIREASNLLRTWRLSETTLYVTLEPCPMCAGAILQARIDTIVWGAPNKLLGADGSWIRIFPSGDGGNSLEQSDKPAAPVHPFHPKITIRRGVLASECADTMKEFFQLRRKNKSKKPETPPPSTRVSISQHPAKLLKRMQGAFHICM